MERGNVRNLVLAFPDGAPVDLAADAAGPTCSLAAVADAGGTTGGMPASGGIGAMPRDDVLRYIAEMCDALGDMARAQQCNALARLLHDAASEAERCRPPT